MSIENQRYSNSKEIEKILVSGDLATVSAEHRTNYYMKVCDLIGLNPFTRPFDYIVFPGGKMTLYANKNCAEQLRKIYQISVIEMTQQVNGDVLTVIVKGVDKDGRMDVSSGVINLTGMKGDALANAYLKAETKAKRRLTLSICGLGMLDETEVDTIPGIMRVNERIVSDMENNQLNTGSMTKRGTTFGQMVYEFSKMYRIPMKDLTEHLFDEIQMQDKNLIIKNEQSWKDKGAIMSKYYEICDIECRNNISSKLKEIVEKTARKIV